MTSWRLEASESEEDAMWRLHPERQFAIAHDSAALLVREDSLDRESLVKRLNSFVDEEGLDVLAQLWASANKASLPRALWRLYQLRQAVAASREQIGHVTEKGIASLNTIDPVVLGAEQPVTAESIVEIVDEILSGTFTGDLANALERASALASVVGAGILGQLETGASEDHHSALQSLVWRDVAQELATAAQRERRGQLH
jgi:hypothetical protein